MTRHLYRLKYRRRDDPMGRVIRDTVIASSPDEARAYMAIKDQRFGSTTETPRRVKEVVEPDPIDEAKAREARTWSQEWHGHRIEVEEAP